MTEKEVIEKNADQIRTKPDFNPNVIAKIESAGSITSNMSDIRNQAIRLRDFYSNVVIQESDIKDMKNEKALINKAKKAVADYRKNIVAEFKRPITDFESTAKDTEKILSEAYDFINDQIGAFEEETRLRMVDELKAYFDEYKKVSHLDWLEYERMNQNVVNSGSLKKYRIEITDFINLVSSHIRAIGIQPEDMQADLLVEYKKSLNFTQAMTEVIQRRKALEEEKDRQEALNALKAKEEEAIQKVEEIAGVQEVTVPEEIAEPVKEKIYTVNLKISGTKEQLKKLKDFMETEGMTYDTNREQKTE